MVESGYMTCLETSKRGIDRAVALYFDEEDLQKQRVANQKKAIEVLSPLSQKLLSEAQGTNIAYNSAVSFDTSSRPTHIPAPCGQ